MANKKDAGTAPAASSNGKWNVPTGRRTDEWSEALVLIGESQDRGAFTRFFRHFACNKKSRERHNVMLLSEYKDDGFDELN